jgi:hypothetical protein
MSYKILIIGCGNIWAGYDFENEFIQTHAKAFYLHPKFQLTFFDIDAQLAQKIDSRYHSEFLVKIEETNLSNFVDLICFNEEIIEKSNWHDWFNDKETIQVMQKHYYPNTIGI